MQQPLDYGATPKALAQNLELVLSSEHLKVFPSSIPEFRLVMERDQFFFSELANHLRKHLVLLDIVD